MALAKFCFATGKFTHLINPSLTTNPPRQGEQRAGPARGLGPARARAGSHIHTGRAGPGLLLAEIPRTTGWSGSGQPSGARPPRHAGTRDARRWRRRIRVPSTSSHRRIQGEQRAGPARDP